ncbi:MAG: M14 family metallopeptidase [Chloroherpetonaceae bacterium]|nr:M14 family metallopeptidase [Chloroherpetonaceae bacterium]
MKRAFILGLFLLTSSALWAQIPTSYYFPPNTRLNAQITSPEKFFGFQVGDWHLRPDQIDAYFQLLVKESPRLKVETIGQTVEMRPLILATVSSPENMKNLESIKAAHRKLTEPLAGKPASLGAMPLVVWMGYSVHGNEPSGANASVLVAYYLAAAEGEEIESILKNTVILLDPHINPDGIARFAHWANIHKGEVINPDANHAEHQEPWLSGRFNHYWFDLNRDWMPVQQKESKARVAKFHEWMPNILTDHHEMGTNATFFFQPGVPSRTNPLTPKINQTLTEKIAAFHAKALDGIGSLYYTKEGFDDFYYGKGSTFPDIHGCVGILFEQASARGHAQESSNGTVTFPFTIRNQVTTSLSTLRAGVALRTELLQYQQNAFATAYEEALRDATKGYLISAGGDRARLFHFQEILAAHGIEFKSLKKDLAQSGLVFKKEESLYLPLVQRETKLLQAMFQEQTSFTDSLFYDISAWSMARAFGFQFAPLKQAPEVEAVPTTSFPKGEMPSATGSIYAFAFEWKHYYAPKALYRLMKSGIRAYVAREPFSTGERQRFAQGTIVIPLGNQSLSQETIKRRLAEIAEQDAITVVPLTTGLNLEGPALGSEKFLPLEMPKILLITGAGVSPTDAGDVWHLLDSRMNMAVTLSEGRRIRAMNLNRYNILLMTGGTYSELDAESVKKIRDWVEAGGTMIALESAADWAIEKGLSSAVIKKLKSDTVKPGNVPFRDVANYEGAKVLAGSIFEVGLDLTNPLAFGYEEPRQFLFRTTRTFLEKPKQTAMPAFTYAQKPLQSGYMHPEQMPLASGAATGIVTARRNGSVVVFPENLCFRAFWLGTNKILMNAIFFSALLRESRGGGGENDNH